MRGSYKRSRQQDRYLLCDLRTLGGRMRMARYCSGLKWTQVAYRVGYSAHSIKSWEMGRRSIPASAIAEICRFGECDSDWLLTGVGKPPTRHRQFLHIGMDGKTHDPFAYESNAGLSAADRLPPA